jgi:hypothetical protein
LIPESVRKEVICQGLMKEVVEIKNLLRRRRSPPEKYNTSDRRAVPVLKTVIFHLHHRRRRLVGDLRNRSALRAQSDESYTAIMPCVMPGAGSVLQPIR